MFAEETSGRAALWEMIYDQKARCRSARARLLAALDRDLHRARSRDKALRSGSVEWTLDMFERDIDGQIQGRFAF